MLNFRSVDFRGWSIAKLPEAPELAPQGDQLRVLTKGLMGWCEAFLVQCVFFLSTKKI